MLLQNITSCVEKPPWRVAIPFFNRTVEIGDIGYAATGAAVGMILALPLVFLLGIVPLMFGIMFGSAGGILVRKISPAGIGWRKFIRSFVDYRRLLKLAQKEESISPTGKGIPYQGLMVRAPRHVKETDSLQLMRKDIAVGEGYRIRE